MSAEKSNPGAGAQPSRHVHAVTASFLGWTLDAFDFFVLVFLVDTLATEFGVSYTTVRHANMILRERGLIHSIHGRGTYVADSARHPS